MSKSIKRLGLGTMRMNFDNQEESINIPRDKYVISLKYFALTI